jgi:hypothetical protein
VVRTPSIVAVPRFLTSLSSMALANAADWAGSFID